MEGEVIRKGLQTGAFANGEITNATVRKGQHVLATRHPVITCLEGFGGLVDGATRVPGVRPRPALETMIGDGRRSGALRIGQITDGVAYRQPGPQGGLLVHPLGPRLQPRDLRPVSP